MAAALISRLVYHCSIVNIRGNSERMRQHGDLWHSLQQSESDNTENRKKKQKKAVLS